MTRRLRSLSKLCSSSEGIPKRQKTSAADATSASCAGGTAFAAPDGMAQSPTPNFKLSPNTHPHRNMKGRKRFTADLDLLKGECKGGWNVRGLRIDGLQAGDDEGSFECSILRADESRLASLGFLVSDTSEYPTNHQYFCFSQEADVPPRVMDIIQGLHEDSSKPMDEMLKKLLTRLSIADKSSDSQDETDIEDEFETDDDMGMYVGESDDESGIDTKHENIVANAALHRDFIEIVANGFRPGMVRFGTNDFALSVSLPIVILARDIPVRALMAWDKTLLSRSQHLTLLISGLRGAYPICGNDGTMLTTAAVRGVTPQFKIGLTTRYKPDTEHVADTLRTFGLKENVPPLPSLVNPMLASEPDPAHIPAPRDDSMPPESEQAVRQDDGFRVFSLSPSLETLLNTYLLRVVQVRLKYDLGWAGAETLCWEAERLQKNPQDIFKSMRERIRIAEDEEIELSQTYNLPPDPLLSHSDRESLNLPLVAFCYLLRRLTLCARYCPVCHNRLNKDYEVLRPSVCDRKLCAYQYYIHNRGASLEYEICTNPETVDLLVNFAYVAAVEHGLEEPLPVGLGLRVPKPNIFGPPEPSNVKVDGDGLCGFDELSLVEMRSTIASLIDQLPSVMNMKAHLEQNPKPGRAKPKLKDIDPTIPDAAWLILRWCIASCTAHLEELRAEEDLVQNIDSSWRQFRFSVGAADAEAKFRDAVHSAQQQDQNAKQYPSLYAFHGSPMKNWHSIIRHGLWYKTVAHGRAFGHGVYFAKDGMVSGSGYAAPAGSRWRNSVIPAGRCMALAEIVNLPSKFTSSHPYFVVPHTEWIICRYLLVQTYASATTAPSLLPPGETDTTLSAIPSVSLDPMHPLTLANARIRIPDPTYKIGKMLAERLSEHFEEGNDEDDEAVIAGDSARQTHAGASDTNKPDDGFEDGADSTFQVNDWEHDPAWVQACVAQLMPPPVDATPMATMALQRELKAMLREQKEAKSFRELGWYMPQDLTGDNLFQWIVELHSFEPELPISQDLETRGVNSLVFEIRFPPTFPHSPPFFRILKPRFLPFIHGGGGHITGGGSMCMDLLTADGWLPSYSISAVLLQIKLAISNIDPRPARLAPNWDTPYHIGEALEGYRRAAQSHGWKIPEGLDKLASYY
ncbi:hypothetical protein OBBRIDRAFT_791754 [Obba rivulosa]|uniref:UBC core domain-containing protein n=1 Tax=Obba rivulosa TaxID=1052685 RepID=A0A8E2DKY8_9APHY|nr:hypothetical protein OBBRIDRAFT_791754 [Obba rivulosa]